MSSFIYYPPAKDLSGLTSQELRFRYFVQLSPDRRHLVPGILHQGQPPSNNRSRVQWLEVGKINQSFDKRYFVKQNKDIRTLVPGSLIEAERLPAGRWKEIKKKAPQQFHRVVFTTGGYNLGLVLGDFTNIVQFNADKVLPVLSTIYPEINYTQNPASYLLYYFPGNYSDLDSDPSKLQLFSQSGALMLHFYSQGPDFYSAQASTNITAYGGFQVGSGLPDGNSSIVMALNTGGTITDYIVFDSIITTSNGGVVVTPA
jgi:hypothetical protein